MNNIEMLLDLREKINEDVDYVRKELSKWRKLGEVPSLAMDLSKSDSPNFADMEARRFADSLKDVNIDDHRIMLGNVKA